ncbi:MAG: YbaB/EbfC family nucleoid-associated protein [bacterium]
MNPAMMNKLRKMQKEMMETQKRLEETIFNGTAGGGMVKIEATGAKQILKINIDEEVLTKEDKEMLEDTIVAALNDLFKNIDEETQHAMAPYTGGMPGMF